MKYIDDWGNIFEDEEEALEAARESMEIDDYADFFDFQKLYLWAIEQPSFYEVFDTAITNAETEYFNMHFTPLEDDDEEQDRIHPSHWRRIWEFWEDTSDEQLQKKGD